MPSAQVIDFGPDPRATAMSNFGDALFGRITQKAEQKRNEDIFRKIKDNYGKEASPEVLYREVLGSEGMDQNYKKDILSTLKDYAALTNKSYLNANERDKLKLRADELATRNMTNDIANRRLKNEEDKVKNAADKAKKELPQEVAKYTANALKTSDIKLRPDMKAELDSFVRQLVDEEKAPIDQAFQHAYRYIEALQDLIDEGKITERPGFFSKGSVKEAMDQAEVELQKLHDEDGITNQKDLRAIAERSLWKPEEITEMLNRVFQRNGKKLKGPSPKAPVKPKGNTPEQSAEIPFMKQGMVSEQAGIDNLLFGE